MILETNAQHANPDLCRHLWELGVSAETVMYWIRTPQRDWYIGSRYDLPMSQINDPAFGEVPYDLTPPESMYIYPAYSVAELFEVLREYSNGQMVVSPPRYDMGGGIWVLGFKYAAGLGEGETVADSLATLLIHIIEQQRKEG